MKIRILSVTLICALLAPIGLRAEEGGAPKQKEPQTELGGKMEKMSTAYNKLRRQIADSTKNDDSLTLIATIRENANAALNLTPAKKADVPADQQAKFVSDYQAQIKKLLTDLGAVEAALKAGNNAEAETLFAAVKKDQTDGHADFKKKKKMN